MFGDCRSNPSSDPKNSPYPPELGISDRNKSCELQGPDIERCRGTTAQPAIAYLDQAIRKIRRRILPGIDRGQARGGPFHSAKSPLPIYLCIATKRSLQIRRGGAWWHCSANRRTAWILGAIAPASAQLSKPVARARGGYDNPRHATPCKRRRLPCNKSHTTGKHPMKSPQTCA